MNTLYCFQNDLRLTDNTALAAAIKNSQSVSTCYILDTSNRELGAAAKWWLHHSLEKLQQNISHHRGKLILRTGNWHEEVLKLAKETKSKAIYLSKLFNPFALAQYKKLETEANKLNIEIIYKNDHLLFLPGSITNKQEQPYRVFTHFWNTCLAAPAPVSPVRTKFDNLSAPSISSDALQHWQLIPTKPNWAKSFSELWQPGEKAALVQFNKFLEDGLLRYQLARNFPAMDLTSYLSPYLQFGEISPRIIWHEVLQLQARDINTERHVPVFLSELGWREFSHHMLYYYPNMVTKPFKQQFAKFPWKMNKKHFDRWCRGETGFPLIDAGMRQLWHTGYMHNRVRMVVASFLVKNLLISWRDGEAWFWDTLVDADLCNNVANWQWVAGSGADAAPYFRIFNPVTQSKQFDPNGAYIRKWVSELKNLPGRLIHEPWNLTEEKQQEFDFRPGIDYPHPMVDLQVTRKAALTAFQETKK